MIPAVLSERGWSTFALGKWKTQFEDRGIPGLKLSYFIKAAAM